MSKYKSKEKIIQHTNNAINKIQDLLDNLLDTEPSKADKLSYWLEDYSNYLSFEDTFMPDKLQRYKRGDIIKVDFGFRVGAEFGGLHYCVVLDNYNPIKATTLTVVPLSSLKKPNDVNHLPKDRVFLGLDLSYKISEKAKNSINILGKAIDIAENQSNTSDNPAEIMSYIVKMKNAQRSANQIIAELKKMKHGSIALVGQITTVSKMRIYDPKGVHSVLHGIRLSQENLDLINNKIKELYVFH